MGLGLGKSSSSSKNTQQQQQATQTTTTPNLSPEAAGTANNILTQLGNYSNPDFNASTLVAGASPDQQAAYAAAQGLGSNAGLFSQAQTTAQGAADPTTLDINQFQNPYQQQVIDTTLANQDNTAAAAQAALEAQGAKSGAFGGSRFGLAQSNLVAQQGLDRATTEAGLRNTGYNTAVTAAQQEQQLNQADKSRALQAAGLFGDLATSQGNDARANIATQLAAGQDQRGVTQDQNNAQLNLLNILSQLYGQVNPAGLFGSTTTGNGTLSSQGTGKQTGYSATLS